MGSEYSIQKLANPVSSFIQCENIDTSSFSPFWLGSWMGWVEVMYHLTCDPAYSHQTDGYIIHNMVPLLCGL